jgi:hypothetical protein
MLALALLVGVDMGAIGGSVEVESAADFNMRRGLLPSRVPSKPLDFDGAPAILGTYTPKKRHRADPDKKRRRKARQAAQRAQR